MAVWVLFFFVGLVPWLFRFTTHNNRKNEMLICGVLAFFVVASIIVAESLVMYSILENGFAEFVTSVPLRVILVTLLYILLVVFYKLKLENDDEQVDDVLVAEETIEQLEPIEIIDRISVRSGQKINVVDVNEVLFIKAEGDYVSIVSKNGHWLKEQTMKYFEQHLPQNKFLRIHRSYIVNLEMISRIERYGQQQLVELRNGEKIKISSTGYKLLRVRLNL